MAKKSLLYTAICFGLLFILLTNNYSGGFETWSDSDYEIYDYVSFATMPAANGRVDMNNIDYPLLDAAIFYETNRRRVENNRKPFLHSPALEKAATGHSRDMVAHNFFSHTSPVKGKETMRKRLALVGITRATTGENIANTFGIEYEAGKSVYTPPQNGGYFSYEYKGEPIQNHTYLGLAKAALDMWMHSPGHRANILNPKFTYLGAGAAHYNNSGFFDMDYFKLTQNFASIKGPVEE
jgi:uncharacterized protein YkwD